MGVVSGIVLSYQFGTNWSRFSVVAGNVIGPLIGYEVLTAFFLEATFLGILLFGWQARAALAARAFRRDGRGRHRDVGVLDPVRQQLDADAGRPRDARRHRLSGRLVGDHLQSELSLTASPHMLNAAYLTTSLVSWRWARATCSPAATRRGRAPCCAWRSACWQCSAPLQLLIGDQHGLNTLEHQPMKIAAMEAHWDGSKPGELCCSPGPTRRRRRTCSRSRSRKAGSLILTHDPDGLFPGLKDVPPADRPPLVPVFFAFRIMVGIGFFMIAVGLVGAWLWWRRTLFEARWYLQLAAHSWWLGFVAVISGWVVTESGRQPWIAYGILRTADAISPVPGASMATTLALVRARLRHRVHDGHLLHQPADRAGTARAGGRAAPYRHAGPAVVSRHRRRARNLVPATVTRGKPWKPYLPVIWAGVIGTAVALYVILDGFDLGIGILFPFAEDERERDQMMDSIAPFWDGNETWLVLGGGGLWVAFPQAYAVIMPALYLPVIVMLLALVFRGVAFEFRSVAVTSKGYWNFAFAGGSTLAAFARA